MKGEFHPALAQWKESLSQRWLRAHSHPALTPCRISKQGEFFWIFCVLVLYSTLFHLPSLRFHCVRGCWTQCRLSTLVSSCRSSPRVDSVKFNTASSDTPQIPLCQRMLDSVQTSNGNASETKANESFDNGVFFDIEAKRTPSIVSKLFSKRSEHIR